MAEKNIYLLCFIYDYLKSFIYILGLDDFIYTMSMPGYVAEQAVGHSRLKTFPIEARKLENLNKTIYS